MKKFSFWKSAPVLLFALAVVVCLLSCDDGNNTPSPISGDWKPVTDIYLKNTTSPFKYDDTISVKKGDFYTATDWTASANVLTQGNVSIPRNYALGVMAFTSVTLQEIINGKIYQTVELPAGAYRFDAYLYENNSTSASQGRFRTYVAAVLGEGLPDIFEGELTDAIESTALGFVKLPVGRTTDPIPSTKPVYSVLFTLPQQSTVSLGFVTNQSSTATGYNFRTFFEKFELWYLAQAED